MCVADRREVARIGGRRSSGPGATTASGNSARTVRLIELVGRVLSVGDTGDGSAAAGQRLELDRVVGRPCAHVLPSRCSTRVARQDAEVDGRLGAAGQHVVLVAGVARWSARWWCAASRWCSAPFSSCACTSGPNSQRLDSATRLKPLISGASVSNISRATPLDAAGQLLGVEPAQRGAHACRWRCCPAAAASTNGPACRVERQHDRCR